jgi:hypothetical protein
MFLKSSLFIAGMFMSISLSYACIPQPTYVNAGHKSLGYEVDVSTQSSLIIRSTVYLYWEENPSVIIEPVPTSSIGGLFLYSVESTKGRPLSTDLHAKIKYENNKPIVFHITLEEPEHNRKGMYQTKSVGGCGKQPTIKYR